MLSSLDMRDGMQLFLCAVSLFGAYCAALGVISGRIQNRSGIVPAAMILLCIFGCVGVMLFFVFQVTGESSIVLFMPNSSRAALGITICPRSLTVTVPQMCLPLGAGAMVMPSCSVLKLSSESTVVP